MRRTMFAATLLFAATLFLAGCAADAGGGGGQRLTAIYSPPVRLGGTGSMMFLPAAQPIKLPIEALPNATALIAGKGMFAAREELADAAACRARIDAIGARATRRYRGSRAVVVPGGGELTVTGPVEPPATRALTFRCEGAALVRSDGLVHPHPYIAPPPLPPIRR